MLGLLAGSCGKRLLRGILGKLEVDMHFHLRAGVVYRVKRAFPWMGGWFHVGEYWRLAGVEEVAEERVYICNVNFENPLNPRFRQTWSKTQPLEADSGADIFEEVPAEVWEKVLAETKIKMKKDDPGGGAMTVKSVVEGTGVCAHLADVLATEIRMGNRIKSVTKDVAEIGAVDVLLMKAFRKKHEPAGVTFCDVNDVHWWKAEYFCPAHRCRVACLFDE